MENKPAKADLNKIYNFENEITADLTKEIEKLHSLSRLKANIETSGITDSIQNEIDLLILTTFENTELNKIKNDILNIYNQHEKESRTFFGYVYPDISQRKQAEIEYIEIKSLKNLAENTFDINDRKQILDKINNMSFTNKNISSFLYEIDIICRTFNGTTYKSLDELKIALSEKKQLNEFIQISEVLDQKIEISAIINIKRKFNEIKKHKYLNNDINKYITEIDSKLSKLERNVKNINGRTYSTLEEVQKIQEELYYIDNETYKFDMDTRVGLELFLELMSIRTFFSIEAKEKLNEYKNNYLNFENEYIQEKKLIEKESKKLQKRKKFKIAKISSIVSVVSFIFSIFMLFNVNTGLGISLICFSLILALVSIIYMIYYKTTIFIDYSINTIKHKTNNSVDKLKSKIKNTKF